MKKPTTRKRMAHANATVGLCHGLLVGVSQSKAAAQPEHSAGVYNPASSQLAEAGGSTRQGQSWSLPVNLILLSRAGLIPLENFTGTDHRPLSLNLTKLFC